MDIDNSIKPYLISGGYPVRRQWHFFTPRGKAIIKGSNALLRKLLPLCDGHTPFSEIVSLFQEKDEIKQALGLLFHHQILVDSSRIFEIFYSYSQNPMLFYEEMTPEETHSYLYDKKHLPIFESLPIEGSLSKTTLHAIMDRRCSKRVFCGLGVDAEKIFSLLWSGYGTQTPRDDENSRFLERTYTVPSGGALYPLSLYIILQYECSILKKGIYYWQKEANCLQLVREGDFASEIHLNITGIENIRLATGVVCVVANFERTAKKYGNKSYNLIQQEVGHVMQNIALFCADNNLGVVEIGGYEDEGVASLIGVKFPSEAPLIVAAFGEMEVL